MSSYLTPHYPNFPDHKYNCYSPVSLEDSEDKDYYVFDFFPDFDDDGTPLNTWRYWIILGLTEDFDTIVENVSEEKLKPRTPKNVCSATKQNTPAI
jgi:hypothetical protein